MVISPTVSGAFCETRTVRGALPGWAGVELPRTGRRRGDHLPVGGHAQRLVVAGGDGHRDQVQVGIDHPVLRAGGHHQAEPDLVHLGPPRDRVICFGWVPLGGAFNGHTSRFDPSMIPATGTFWAIAMNGFAFGGEGRGGAGHLGAVVGVEHHELVALQQRDPVLIHRDLVDLLDRGRPGELVGPARRHGAGKPRPPRWRSTGHSGRRSPADLPRSGWRR